jgi:iron complex outermembrane recepter protein
MIKTTTKRYLALSLFFVLWSTLAAFAQVKVAGKITEAGSREPLAGISIQVKGKVIGTITDTDGNFSLTTSTAPPFTLVISSVGFQTQEVRVTGDQTNLDISMREQVVMGQEVVVSASRVEESILQSPVAIEKMDIREIRNTPAASFYDAIANMKGVDMTTQGLLFKSINMRGFGSTGNPRIVQMIDGMDNSAPGLNFPVDNIVGMPELDVESVEVLPGAASALYGPNAINGLILMNSKSPFLYQGLSANFKTGVMSASNRSQAVTPFGDLSIRYAKAINNKFAYKVNLSYLQAKDWEATNYADLNNSNPDQRAVENGTRGPGVALDYDGVNTYGDEVQANLRTVGQGLVSAGLLPSAALGLVPTTNVSRTGFFERDLVDYNTKSFKANMALHYRLNDKVEAIGQINYGYGTTVYTGTGRYSLRNFNLTQAKLELRGDNFTLRGYTTQERSGQSYVAGLSAVAMLNDIKAHPVWFGEYTGAFVQARSQGAPEAQAHAAARQFADRGMPQPGTEAFTSLLDKYRDKPISQGGSGFLDKTNLYHAEGLYNFKNEIKFVDLSAGANIRQYQLRSEGTLFADTKDGRNGSIGITEYGAFVQAGKSLLNNHLRLSGSVRYDKNQNFEGQFTPRLSAVTSFGMSSVRLSYQTGFRIPTTQNQFIDLATPAGVLIGGLPEFVQRYNLDKGILRENLDPRVIAQYASQPAVIAAATQYATAAITQQVTAQVTAGVNAAVAAGQIPNIPQVIQGAIQQQVAANLPGALQANLPGVVGQVLPAFALAAIPKYQAPAFRPERIASYEIGYKGVIGRRLFVDAYYYLSKYTNFIGGTVVIVPTAAAGPGLPIESGVSSANTRIAYSRPANSNQDITVQGFAVSADYSLPNNYFVGGNMANNELTNFVPSPEVQFSQFNTPRNRYNFRVGKRITSTNRYGFNVQLRHQDGFTWESGFLQATTTGVPLFQNTKVLPITNLDAQVSVKLPAIKSILKVGGTNLFGKPYVQAYGSAAVGSMYYVSLTFDELLN